MDRWANKVAVVTGGGSGMGAQFSKDLCSFNVTVVALDFNEEYLDKTTSEILSHNPSARFTPILCDLTEEEQIKSSFERIIQEFGGVDILINCAGMVCNSPVLQDEGQERLIKTVQTNLLAVISCTKKAYKSMADRDVAGQIVNICSVAGHAVCNVPGMKPISTYCATKSAVKTLNQMIGHELVYYNNQRVRVSNISPGYVGQTNLAKGTGAEGAMKDAKFMLFPKDISDALIFILSAPGHVQIREVVIESVGCCWY